MITIDWQVLTSAAGYCSRRFGVEEGDIISEAYLRLTRSKEPVAHKALIYLACRHAALELRRREDVRSRYFVPMDEVNELCATERCDVSEAMAIRQALEGLPERDLVVLEAYARCLNARLAAAELGIQPVTFKARLVRARKRARARLPQ